MFKEINPNSKRKEIMEAEFTSYELALDLKELGFDEPCFGYYYPEAYSEETILMDSALDPNHTYYNEFPNKGDLAITYNYNEQFISAPTFSQAFRWFREKYKMQSEILWRGDMGCFCYKTGKFKYGEHTFSEKDYKTYEKAELECLKKLIQIVKSK